MSIDREEIRRRLLLRLFGEPITLTLGLGGVMALLAAPLFGLAMAVPAFLGISGLAGAAGILTVRGVVWKEQITRALIEELQAEEAAKQEGQLDALAARLERDRDPRTEALLNDLRTLAKTVRDDPKWRARINAVAAADILRQIAKLFEGCVDNLERTLELHDTASRLATKRAGDPLREERERLVGEVERSVSRLSELVTQLRVLGTESDDTAPDLAGIRAALDENLAAVKATAAETRSWSEKQSAARGSRARQEEIP